jgi:hypothetical protein
MVGRRMSGYFWSEGKNSYRLAGLAGDHLATTSLGGTEYRLGRREIGHVHGDSLVDIPFPKRIRNELVTAGRAEPHHILPESGWVSIYLRQAADVDRAIELLRLSFEIADHRVRK